MVEVKTWFALPARAIGARLQGEGPVERRWVDRVVGLKGVRAEIAVVQTPDGRGRLERAGCGRAIVFMETKRDVCGTAPLV